MDYSVQEYLERRSSAELFGFLRTCMLKRQWGAYEAAIPLIFRKLEGRGLTIPEEILASWSAFLRGKEEKESPTE